MGETCIFSKRNRVAGIQDIKLGGETISEKIRFYKKPPKPQTFLKNLENCLSR